MNAIHLDDKRQLWVVDTGTTALGADRIPGGAKLIVLDLQQNSVARVIPLDHVAPKGSYLDDVRFANGHAYLTDAGAPALVVVDTASGKARRVLEHHPSTVARADRDVVADGQIVRGPDGAPLRVNADPLEVSPDGQWLYYGPLAGPWSRIATRWLDDPDAGDPASHVEPWADLPPTP